MNREQALNSLRRKLTAAGLPFREGEVNGEDGAPVNAIYVNTRYVPGVPWTTFDKALQIVKRCKFAFKMQALCNYSALLIY